MAENIYGLKRPKESFLVWLNRKQEQEYFDDVNEIACVLWNCTTRKSKLSAAMKRKAIKKLTAMFEKRGLTNYWDERNKKPLRTLYTQATKK
jgi:hypothetical protein